MKLKIVLKACYKLLKTVIGLKSLKYVSKDFNKVQKAKINLKKIKIRSINLKSASKSLEILFKMLQ